MNAQRTPNRAHLQPIPSNASHDLSPQAAALRGASLAFQHHVPKLSSSPTRGPSTPVDHGALVAATSASREHSEVRPSAGLQRAGSTAGWKTAAHEAISRHTTGGSVQDRGSVDHAVVARPLSQLLSSPTSAPGNSPYLLPPGGRPGMDSRNPSFIAATLAASRSASPSPSPNHTGASPLGGSGRQLGMLDRRRPSLGAISVHSSSTSLGLPDTSSIAPTTSLISMFEDRKDETGPSLRGDGSPGRRLDAKPSLRLPTPPRELSPKRKDADPEPKKISPKPKPLPKPRPTPTVRSRPSTPPPQVVHRAATEIVSPEPRRIERRPKLNPPTPPPARSATMSTKQAAGPRAAKPKDDHRKAPSPIKSPKPRSQPSSLDITGKPPQREQRRTVLDAAPVPRPSTARSSSSNDSFVSASSNRSPSLPSRPDSHQATPPKPISRPSTPRLRRAFSARKPSSTSPTRPTARRTPTVSSIASASTNNLPLDSLTSAIMAGSLASARHTPHPSSKTPPPPPPARKLSPRRTGLLQTLRQPPSKDEEIVRHHHHHHRLVGGKKHAHHEGARHRWRDTVTERERRRYEAVWASNRGLFLSNDRQDSVAAVVARDIWARSRLPFDELAEVWDLVDREGKGLLGKEEFVVGMWLIDQRLRGRKIPPRVSQSVWDSVKALRVSGPGRKNQG